MHGAQLEWRGTSGHGGDLEHDAIRRNRLIVESCSTCKGLNGLHACSAHAAPP
jgi:hypothetical protein